MSWKQIVTHEDKKTTMLRVWEMVCKGVLKGPVLVTLGRPSRSLQQNAKFHALLADSERRGEWAAPAGNGWQGGTERSGACAAGQPTKLAPANRKVSRAISDIRAQGAVADPEGNKRRLSASSLEDVKAALVDAFSDEMDQQGSPLRKPSRHTWNWISKRFVYVRPSTTDFNKEEASNFIEFLYLTGTDMGVQWSPIVTQIYNEYREAQK